MKTLPKVLLLTLLSVPALAQIEVAKSDTAAASQTTRIRYGATSAGLPGYKLSTGNFVPLATKSSVDAIGASTVSTVNGISPTSGNVNVTFAALTSKPTTISGFGITDGVSTGGSYANPSWITSLAASKITGLATVATSGLFADLGSKPTTVSGYGITDGVSTGGSYTNPSWLVSIPFSKLTSTPTTVSGYGLTDAVATGGSYSNPTWITALAYSKLTGTPTTLSGYGITDAALATAVVPYASVATYSALSGVSAPASGYLKFVRVAADERYNEVNSLYFIDSGLKILKVATIKEN